MRDGVGGVLVGDDRPSSPLRTAATSPAKDETERREAGPRERLAQEQLREDQGAHGHHLIAHSGLRTKLYWVMTDELVSLPSPRPEASFALTRSVHSSADQSPW